MQCHASCPECWRADEVGPVRELPARVHGAFAGHEQPRARGVPRASRGLSAMADSSAAGQACRQLGTQNGSQFFRLAPVRSASTLLRASVAVFLFSAAFWTIQVTRMNSRIAASAG